MKQDLISENRNLGRIFKGSWFQAFRDVLIVVGLFLRTQHSSRATWLATFWQNYPTKNPWFYEFFTGQPATKLLEHPRKDKNIWWISGNLFTGFLWIFFTWQAHHFAKIIPSIFIYIYNISCEVHTAFKQRSQFEKNKHTEKTGVFKVFVFLHPKWELLISGDLIVAEANSNSPIFISYQRKADGWTFSNLKCLTIPCKITVIR